MNYFFTLALVLLCYMTVWFIISILKKRNDVADVAWGLGFVLLVWTSFGLSEFYSVRGLVIGILVTIWGLRLAWHIYLRNKDKVEDYRYLAWRKEWGRLFYVRSYIQVYLFQGILLFLIAVPILLLNGRLSSDTFGLSGCVGIVVWLIGFFFESVGDFQLSKFIQDPSNKGSLMQHGLWRYTRHPNYFGEVTQWWGIWLISLSTPYIWYSVVGPFTITFLILRVSGIPMLEKKMQQHPDFPEYKKRTSVFFPLPPKS